MRELTVTTVPTLVNGAVHLYPFLAPDCADRGVPEGREVYAFSPSLLSAQFAT
jgi:hypothetical protein